MCCGCTSDNAYALMCSDDRHTGNKVSLSELVSTPAVNFVIHNNTVSLFRAMYWKYRMCRSRLILENQYVW